MDSFIQVFRHFGSFSSLSLRFLLLSAAVLAVNKEKKKRKKNAKSETLVVVSIADDRPMRREIISIKVSPARSFPPFVASN